jgi:hypothetical protein
VTRTSTIKWIRHRVDADSLPALLKDDRIEKDSCRDKDDDIFYIQKCSEVTKVKISITGSAQVFTATLLDNNSARAFREMLPLTMKMTELNGNEKYCDLNKSLPTNPSSPKMIANGELMLYGSETLVLFYATFSTSYSYTKLGQVDDATSLASALGSGNVTVTFELE